MSESKYKYIVSIGVFLIALYVYIITLAPTVWFIDSGELAAVASTLGIAHPTGYPLFTIVGYIFTKLPISSSEVYNLNVMSAFFCSLGVFVFYYLMIYLFSSPGSQKTTEKLKKPIHKKEDKPRSESSMKDFIALLLIPAITALILAFSRSYWATANSVEVYPIHVFFLSLLTFLFLKAVLSTASSNETFFSSNKYYLMFALALGLSFTNHMTTILLAPACLTLFIYKNLYDKTRVWKLLFWMAVCFLIGFSVYIYLPIRANMEPSFLWGNPYNLERFRWHITGKQFSVWIFSAEGSLSLFMLLMTAAVGVSVFGLVKRKTLNPNMHFFFFIIICILGYLILSSSNKIVTEQFNKFTGSFMGEFGTGLILLAIFGVYYLSRFNIIIFYYTFLTFFACLFYSVNYDINDIFSYFLLAYISLAVWIGFAILYIYRQLKQYLNTGVNKTTFAVIVAAMLYFPLSTNYTYNDESKNYYVEELTMNVFKNAEPNSIIISSQWDFWVSASWYFNHVKKIRPDLVIIDKELLRRSWYFIFIKRHYPEIYNNSKIEIERFLVELDKFEHGIPYDQNTIVKAFEDMITSFVANNQDRHIYTTWEIEQNKQEYFAKDYTRIPDGLLFRLLKNSQNNNFVLSDYKIHDFIFTPVAKTDYYHETIMRTYAMMLTSSAGFLSSNGRTEDAKEYIRLALIAKPNFPQAIEMKRKYNF